MPLSDTCLLAVPALHVVEKKCPPGIPTLAPPTERLSGTAISESPFDLLDAWPVGKEAEETAGLAFADGAAEPLRRSNVPLGNVPSAPALGDSRPTGWVALGAIGAGTMYGSVAASIFAAMAGPESEDRLEDAPSADEDNGKARPVG